MDWTETFDGAYQYYSNGFATVAITFTSDGTHIVNKDEYARLYVPLFFYDSEISIDGAQGFLFKGISRFNGMELDNTMIVLNYKNGVIQFLTSHIKNSQVDKTMIENIISSVEFINVEDTHLPIANIDNENIMRFLDRYIEEEGWSLSYSLDRYRPIVYGTFNTNNFMEIVDEAYADIQGRSFFNLNSLQEIKQISQALNANFPDYELWIIDPLYGDLTDNVDEVVVKLKDNVVLYNLFDASYDMDEEQYLIKRLDKLSNFDGNLTEYKVHYDDKVIVLTPNIEFLSNLIANILYKGSYNQSDKSSLDFYYEMYDYIAGEILRIKPDFKIVVLNPFTIMNLYSDDQILLVYENGACTYVRFPL